ncbi:hypothetical protein CEXT_382741 [Caerostris extrusa]|uniref:Uncharacterized protein n=1 Tax=Caerostris extrusa TaxID=172846 RepID=A0AAV4UGB5_CAEEX|nr:hypothetical protein CEXT_382741 [Caerostris extrusa]
MEWVPRIMEWDGMGARGHGMAGYRKHAFSGLKDLGSKSNKQGVLLKDVRYKSQDCKFLPIQVETQPSPDCAFGTEL